MIAYFLAIVLFSAVFDDWFEPNKMGWTKRASLSLAVMGFLIAILVTFFGASFFPFNLFGNNFLSILFSAWTLIAIPVAVGLFIVQLFAEALGVEYS